MIIRKINLENYRSHKNTSVELTKGINLILGINGSGKSSILEAIGKVIFDINDRSGNQRGKNFIRHGEKSAKIEIEFTANDGREYLIKNTFYTKKVGSTILKDLATEEEYKNKEEVREKLNELCGIKKDYTDVYDNIIIAKQNEFINIFKEKPAKREEVFNKIFNTEIYSEMYAGILKNIEDKYTNDKEKIEIEKKVISSNMKDEDEISKEIENIEIKKENIEKELEILNENKKKLTEKIAYYESRERKLEYLNKEISVQKENIKTLKSNLRKELYNSKKARLSQKLVLENTGNYEKYLSFTKELEILKKDFEILKNIEEKNIELRAKNEKITWEISNNKENLKKYIEEKESYEKNLFSSEKEAEKIIEEGKKLRVLSKEIKEIEESILTLNTNKFSLENEIKNLKFSLEEKEQKIKLIDKDSIDLLISNIEKTKFELEEKKQKIIIFKEKINTLIEAQKKLSEKICPFLSEECENIKDKNVDNYFAERISEEEKNKKILEKNLFEQEQEIKQENELRKIINEFNFLKEDVSQFEKLLNESNLNLQKLNLDIEKKEVEIDKILITVSFKNSEELEKRLNELEISYSSLNLKEKKENLKNINEKIEFLEKDNSSKEKEFEKNNKEIKENISKDLKEKEEKIRLLEEEQKKIQTSYNIYLENINISNTIEETIEAVRQNISNIYKLRIKKKIDFEEKEFIENEIKKILIDKLREDLDKTNLDILNLREILGTVNEKFKNLSDELEKIRAEKEKIESLFFRLKKLENKLYKTKQIRANIKTMGLKISKYMLESISNQASSNFNKITGRSERILWTNDSNDTGKDNKYAVYLVGENRETAFEHLSGGEQVSVAISLRETMTEYFSNSRFIILDEPTNNLDKERKKLLAEYMGEMLNNLEQSIIVTHDNTFREMAEKIIEL